MTLPIIVAALVAAVVFAGFWWWHRRRTNPVALVAAGDRALSEGRAVRAAASFEQAIRILDGRAPGAASADMTLIARAELGLGTALARQARSAEAFDHFKRARAAGASLPPDAVRVLAVQYAASDDASDAALDAYLECLALQGGADAADGPRVLATLEKLCAIDETSNAAARRKALDLTRRVIRVRPELEWAHYFLGVGSLVEGSMARAGEHLDRALALNPGRPLTYYWLAVCRLREGDARLEEAISLMERFLEFPLDSRRAVKRQASGAHEIGRRLFSTSDAGAPARARRFLKAAVERQPDNAEYRFSYACAAEQAGDSSEAVSAFEAAARLAPSNVDYAVRLGVAQERRGDVRAAIATFRRVVGRDEGHETAHRRLADLCLRAGEYAGAEESSRRVLALRPWDPDCLSSLILALSGQARFEDVVEQARKVEAAAGGVLSQAAAFAVGRSFALLTEFTTAIDWYRRLEPTPDVLYALGCARALAGQLDAALATLEAAHVRPGARPGPILFQRGHVLRALGRADEAESSYRAAAAAEPANPEIPYALGGLALERGDLPTSAAWFARAIDMDPSHLAARFAAGVVAERQGQALEAMACYEAAAADPTLAPGAGTRLAILNYRLDRFADALRWLRTTSPPDSDTVLFYRGAIMLALGREQDCLESWSALLERYPDDERLRLNLYRAQYQLGCRHLETGRVDDAIRAWGVYLQRYGMDDKVRKDVAALEFRQGVVRLQQEPPDVAGAAPHVRRALELDDADPVYRLYAALCDLRLGRAQDALVQLLRLASAGSPSPRVLYHLGLCLLAVGQRDEGRMMLTQLMSGDHRQHYAEWAAWAVANEEIRDGRLVKAAQILSSASEGRRAHA
jgi:tetratricopeptide (TPR) repeat protein